MTTLLKKITTIQPPAKEWRNVFTIRDQESPGTAVSTIRKMLKAGITQGIVERQKFPCPVQKRTVWFYREVKK